MEIQNENGKRKNQIVIQIWNWELRPKYGNAAAARDFHYRNKTVSEMLTLKDDMYKKLNIMFFVFFITF